MLWHTLLPGFISLWNNIPFYESIVFISVTPSGHVHCFHSGAAINGTTVNACKATVVLGLHLSWEWPPGYPQLSLFVTLVEVSSTFVSSIFLTVTF